MTRHQPKTKNSLTRRVAKLASFYTITTLLVMSFAPSSANADISRTCRATIDIEILDNKPNSVKRLAEITGKGTCKNSTQANTCRQRARSELNACLSEAWKNRQNNSIPSRCNNMVNGSSRPGAKLTYIGIMPINQPARLTARAARYVCCQARPTAGHLTINFGSLINGNKKCAKHKIDKNWYQEEISISNYNMNCFAWRAQGICN